MLLIIALRREDEVRTDWYFVVVVVFPSKTRLSLIDPNQYQLID